MAENDLLQNSCVNGNHENKSEQQISRRVAQFHPNVWEYEFLQSLSSPYGAPSYCERVNTLIEEIKMDIFDVLVEDGEKDMNPSAYDLLVKGSSLLIFCRAWELIAIFKKK